MKLSISSLLHRREATTPVARKVMIMVMGQSRSMMRLMMTLEMRVRIVTAMIRLEFPCDYYLCAACDGALEMREK